MATAATKWETAMVIPKSIQTMEVAAASQTATASPPSEPAAALDGCIACAANPGTAHLTSATSLGKSNVA